MKKIVCIILSLVLLLGAFSTSSFAVESKVSLATPISSDDSQVKWVQRFGTSYLDAPSSVTVAGDCLLIMSQNYLLKVDRSTGNTLAKAQMVETPGFTYVPVCYDNGVAYCPLDNATIQAFDVKTMKSLWVYHDSLGGQSLTPIVAENGKIYTGFWKDEDKNANFVCIDVKDENTKNTVEKKSADWTYKSLGGFYRTECKIIGNYLYVGCDDGTIYSDRASKILSLNKKTGSLVDSVATTGDIRSGITESGGKIYCVSKAGYLFCIGVNNGIFNDSSFKKLSLGGSSTSTPLIYNSRIYVGVQGSKISSGYMKVIDESNLSVIYSAQTKGYPQSNFLISDYYKNETGKVYIYFTYNYPPGGMCVLVDSAGQTTATVEDIYVPGSSESGYCISPVVADSEGTLYFKNDSGHIFAINKKPKQQPEKKSLFRRIIEWIVSKIKGIFKR